MGTHNEGSIHIAGMSKMFVRNESKSLDGCCLESSFVMTILLFYLIVIWWYGRERVEVFC